MSTTPTRPAARRRLTSSLAVVCGVTALAVSLGAPSEAAKLITGKNIKNNSVAGVDLKNNSVKGKDVDEASLKGLLRPGHVAAYGNASGVFVDNFTSGVVVPLVSKTFAVPTAGFLHVTGAISAEDDSTLAGDGRLSYNLRLDGTLLSNGLHELDYDVAGSGDSGATTAVIPVSAGNHTIALVGNEFGTGSFITAREISALYVPSGSGFTPPAKPAPKGSAQD